MNTALNIVTILLSLGAFLCLWFPRLSGLAGLCFVLALGGGLLLELPWEYMLLFALALLTAAGFANRRNGT